MFHINKVLTRIEAKNEFGKINTFGFEIPLEKGLNIITGKNTSGKSTILSCVYYCLGVEQLFSDKNSKALSVALKKNFKIGTNEFDVIYSEAEIEITNYANQTVQIRRKITTDNTAEDNQKIFITIGEKSFLKFIHRSGDTLRENGFFNWFETFINVKLPSVASFNDKSSKLYFQNIFSGLFVEQKKGWSDYFATSPTFSIKNIKQKIVEFFLDLNSLENEFKIEALKGHILDTKTKWNLKYQELVSLFDKYNAKIVGLDGNKLKSETELASDCKIAFLSDENKLISKQNYRTNLEAKLKENEHFSPIKDDLKKERERKELIKSRMIDLFENIEKLEIRKIDEMNKVKSYNNQIVCLSTEMKNLRDLNLIKDEGIILSENTNYCPLCQNSIENSVNLSQNLDLDLISKTTKHLDSQLQIYKTYLKSSSIMIEKIQKYIEQYYNHIENDKFKLQMLNETLVEDSRLPSREKIYDNIIIKDNLNNIDKIERILNRYLGEFVFIYNNYKQLDGELHELIDIDSKDIHKIQILEDTFKNLLYKFEYSSHKNYHIKFNTDTPFKLLPKTEINKYFESLRTTSSASDFIRALWAFYLSLLQLGENHPGLIIFDEPGQHAMQQSSLQLMLKYASLQTDKQIIVAISKDTKVGSKIINLDEILSDISIETYYEIPNGRQCIDRCST